jgi:hypothetical protein
MTIQAIQTNYKGYRFRSRLEARWAVFFDALGIEWEYEKEGYKLSDGSYYLPDFWLPNEKMWVEIKPENTNEENLKKYYRFRDDMIYCKDSNVASGSILATGLPGEKYVNLYCFQLKDSSAGEVEYRAWIVCVSKEKRLQFLSRDWSGCGDNYSSCFNMHWLDIFPIPDKAVEVPIFPHVWKAAEEAKSKRFEHGE